MIKIIKHRTQGLYIKHISSNCAWNYFWVWFVLFKNIFGENLRKKTLHMKFVVPPVYIFWPLFSFSTYLMRSNLRLMCISWNSSPNLAELNFYKVFSKWLIKNHLSFITEFLFNPVCWCYEFCYNSIKQSLQ